jgi:hypothetical protein
LPRLWIVVVSIAVAASVANIRHGPQGTTIDLHVTTITGVLIATVWLPTLLRVIALTGGGVKTTVGEAQAVGFLDHFRNLPADQQEESLAAAAAVIEHAETQTSDEPSEARQVREEIEEAIARIPRGPQDVQRRLREIAREYERLREEMKAGQERTRAMTELVTRARGLWQADPRPAEAARWYRSAREGDRVIALAGIQTRRDPGDLNIVIDAISRPRSAFEQFHALRAAAAVIPQLMPSELRTLRRAIAEQRVETEDGAHWITPADVSRWQYSQYLLDVIDTQLGASAEGANNPAG